MSEQELKSKIEMVNRDLEQLRRMKEELDQILHVLNVQFFIICVGVGGLVTVWIMSLKR